MLLVVTMWPRWQAIMCGRTHLVRDIGAIILSSIISRSTASSVSTTNARCERPALFTRISIYTWHKRCNDNTVCVLCHNTGCTLYQHCSPGYQSTHDTRDTMTTLCSVYSVTTLDVHSTSIVHQDINLHVTQETQWQHCVCTLSQHWMYTLPALFTSISIYTRHKRRNDNTV